MATYPNDASSVFTWPAVFAKYASNTEMTYDQFKTFWEDVYEGLWFQKHITKGHWFQNTVTVKNATFFLLECVS